jgi:hypothetical protein
MGDEDVLAELEQLEEEVRLEEEAKAPGATDTPLPNAPTKPLPKVEKPAAEPAVERVAVAS